MMTSRQQAICTTLLTLLLCGFGRIAPAQSVAVTCRVRTSQKAPVAGASIRLERAADTTDARQGTTDSTGAVRIVVEGGQTYIAQVFGIGYAPLTGSLLADSSRTEFTFTLQKTSRTLEGAVITARKPLMRQEDDKTIVDPEPLAVASTSSYEVLEKTPGIIADQDGNFFLSSATPATIYINGREMKMSSTDIASMLKSLPPNAILRIEILRTPSARYDASGSGGVINIVLKKGVKVGLTGSVNAGVQQGVYGNQFAGVNLSYNDGDKTAYLNVNYARRKSVEHIGSVRELSADSTLTQEAQTVYESGNFYLGYGAGKTLNKQWEVSYDGRASGTASQNNADNLSTIGRVLSGETASVNRSLTGYDSRSWNIDQSIDAKYKLDTSGSEWTTIASWNGTFSNSRQDILSSFLQPISLSATNAGDIRSTRHLATLQTDLKWKWQHGITWETGGKTAWMDFRFSSDYTATFNGRSFPDPYRSNTYRYRERISALYLQVSKQIGDIIIKPGVRMEHTWMDGVQTRPGNARFGINRTDLFPYLYLSKKVMTIAGFDLRAYLVYRRTILRPAYDYLNPFQRFVDQYLYDTGNPALRPQFTHNYEANISIDERPLIAIGYNDIQDIFSQVVYQSDSNKSVAYRTYDNLGTNKETYFRGLAGIPPGGTYFFIVGGQYNINNYNGYYNGEPLAYKRGSWTFFTYHNLKLGKNMNFTMNGFMRLNGLMQFYELGTFGQLNMNLNRTFLNKKLMISLNAQDIFFTNKYEYSINQGPVKATGSRYNDSQRFGINVRYNFGVKLKEEKKEFMNVPAD